VHVGHHQADGVAQVGRTHRQEHRQSHERPELGSNSLQESSQQERGKHKM
jgi:hypothetical protein